MYKSNFLWITFLHPTGSDLGDKDPYTVLRGHRELPLLNRSDGFPGESLASLFERLARLNYHETTYPIFQLCRERLALTGIHDRELWYPMHPETFGVIARLTGIEPLQLYPMTLHRFAPIITPPEQDLQYIVLPSSSAKPLLTKMGSFKQVRTIHNSRYCPLCLRENQFHQLVWNCVALSTCTNHDCFLIERCPGCDHHLSVRAIVRGICITCGMDLRKVDPTYVDDDQLGMQTQHEIYSWVMNNEIANSHWQVGDLVIEASGMYIKRWESVEIIKCSYRQPSSLELRRQGIPQLLLSTISN